MQQRSFVGAERLRFLQTSITAQINARRTMGFFNAAFTAGDPQPSISRGTVTENMRRIEVMFNG